VRFQGKDADQRVVSGISRSFAPGSVIYGVATLSSLISAYLAVALYAAIGTGLVKCATGSVPRLPPRITEQSYLGALSSAGATARSSSEPGNRADECGRHRPVPADVLASLRWKELERLQRFQRTGSPAHIHVGDLQVARRRFETGMAEQGLYRTEIDAGFEQVSGEGVSKQMRMNGLGDASRTRRFPAGREDRFH